MTMRSLFQEEEDDVFFDSYEHTSTSFDSVFDNLEPKCGEFDCSFWAVDLSSVSERRERFLRAMGFDDLVSSKTVCSARLEEPPLCDQIAELMVPERTVDNIDSMSDLSPSDDDSEEETSDLSEQADTDSLMTLPEFESSVRQSLPFRVSKRNSNSWWRSFLSNSNAKLCNYDASLKDYKLRKAMHMRARHRWNSRQEIQAHNGFIRALRFNPSGSLLASGGEDGVVRIWKVGQVENTCKCCAADVFPQAFDKDFKIEEKPIHEFYGHSAEILDLSWSKSDCLLSSSKDKTIRMWKIGCDECIRVFEHNDYVTCVQYNPVNDRYFISGSIDGKVRIWGVAENRVVDWADTRDIVTAVCYQPDGKGFIVGSMKGVCHFYDLSENNMQLHRKLSAQGRQKPASKRITGLQEILEDF